MQRYCQRYDVRVKPRYVSWTGVDTKPLLDLSCALFCRFHTSSNRWAQNWDLTSFPKVGIWNLNLFRASLNSVTSWSHPRLEVPGFTIGFSPFPELQIWYSYMELFLATVGQPWRCKDISRGRPEFPLYVKLKSIQCDSDQPLWDVCDTQSILGVWWISSEVLKAEFSSLRLGTVCSLKRQGRSEGKAAYGTPRAEEGECVGKIIIRVN